MSATPSVAADYIASIALSAGSGNIDVTADPDAEFYEVYVTAKYAAVAGTSGASIVCSYSLDGSTFVALPAQVLAPAATVVGFLPIRVGNRTILGVLNKIRTVVTNLDGTNAVIVCVGHLAHKE